MIDTLPLGEVARQHAPVDSPLRHIKDGIAHRSHTQGARSSTAFGGGDQIFDPLPFLVSQVAWIDFFVHLPIVPTCEDFSDRLLDGRSARDMREGKNMGIMTTFKKPTLERDSPPRSPDNLDAVHIFQQGDLHLWREP